MALALSIAGVIEAGAGFGAVGVFLWLRALIGLGIVALTVMIAVKATARPIRTPLQAYHLAGVLGDGLGGIVLLLAGGWLFGLMGWRFEGTYEYVVFGFMIGVGVLHWLGWERESEQAANTGAAIRSVVASVFAALYLAGILDGIALLVALYDGAMALVYWLFIRRDA